MYKFSFWASLLCLPICLFAAEMPTYPSEDPTAANLATYYQALAVYYKDQASVYAQKAQIELRTQQTAQNLAPVAIKNPKPFAGSNAGLGLIMNTGNTNSQNFNGTALLNYAPNKASTTTWNTAYQYSHDNQKGQLSDNFTTDVNTAYNFNFTNGIYGDVNYTRNPFSGYNYQINESVGYNHVFYNTDIFALNGQIGPGLQQNSIPSPGGFQNQVSGNLKLLSVYNFSSNANWRETYALTTTQSNTENTLDSAINLILFDPFALQLDYLMSYDTSPQPGKDNFNTATTVSIVYNFQ